MRGFMMACTTGTRRRSVSPWGRRSARWPPRSTCGARLLLSVRKTRCPREPINMNIVEGIGYLAASLVLATFCMKSMDALRLAAIASNMAFIAYGYLGHLAPVLLLHALLLPINIYRLVEPGSPHASKSPKKGADSEELGLSNRVPLARQEPTLSAHRGWAAWCPESGHQADMPDRPLGATRIPRG